MRTSPLSSRYLTARKPAAAFTLTEVALSVGISTLCMLSLLGLIPYGLDSLRNSANRQAEARMVQTVVSAYQTDTWMEQNATGETTVKLADKIFFFDQTGTELANADHVDRVYVVKAMIQPTIPTLLGDSMENPYLRRVTLRFTDRPDYTAAFVEGSGQYVDRPTWIGNIEQTGPMPKP